ncbi:MAG: hypothetical protein AB7E79_01990 [Rhodospirillaceae bacterium]
MGPATLHATMISAIVQASLFVFAMVAIGAFVYSVVGAWGAGEEKAYVRHSHDRTALIVQGLMPLLVRGSPADAEELTRALAGYASDDISLKLFFRQAGSTSGVFLIAQTDSPVAGEQVQAGGILERFGELCDAPDLRGTLTFGASALTTLSRIRSPHGCWGVIAAFPPPTPAAWRSHTPLAVTALSAAALLLLGLWNALRLVADLRRVRAQEADGLPDLAPARIEPVFEVPRADDAIAAAVPSAPQAVELRLRDDVTAPPHEEPSTPADAHRDDAGGLLDTIRGPIDLSQVVRAYVEAERQKPKGAQLAAEIAEGVVIQGRADFVSAILGELIGSGLDGDGKAHITLAAETDESRRRAFLTVDYDPPGAAPGEAMGRLSLVKQFIAALGGVSACEHRDDGGVTVRLAFHAS